MTNSTFSLLEIHFWKKWRKRGVYGGFAPVGNKIAFRNPLFTGVNPRKPPHSGFGPTFSKGWVEEKGG